MSIIDLIRELKRDLFIETGEDESILSIKVSPRVWIGIVAEVHNSQILWDRRLDSSETAKSFQLMGIEITR